MTVRLTEPLLFVASDRREAEPWVARWADRRSADLPVHWAKTGKWRGRDVVAVANGVGPERAGAAVSAVLAATERLAGVFSIGTGGALHPSLAIGDVIVATGVTDGSELRPAEDPHGPAARSGLVFSSPHIARTIAEKRNLSLSGAILVEMESAGVASVARKVNIPFYCVRVVSDLADETFFIDFEKFLTADGRFNVSRLVLYALGHPLKSIPELLRLQRRTSMGAAQLGKFFMHCKF